MKKERKNAVSLGNVYTHTSSLLKKRKRSNNTICIGRMFVYSNNTE